MFNLIKWFKRKQPTLVTKTTEAPKVEKPEFGVATGQTDEIEPESYSFSAEELQNFYLTNSWVRKYVDTVVRGCLKYPLRAVIIPDHRTTESEERVKEINDLLKWANKVEPFSSVREKYLRDLLLYGNGVVEITPRDSKGKIKELYSAPGYLLRVNADERGNLNLEKAYHFLDPETGDKLDITYPFHAIVHFKFDQLSDRVYGTTPITSAYREFNADSTSARQLQTGIQDINPVIITVPKTNSSFVESVIRKVTTMLADKKGIRVAGLNADADAIELSKKTLSEELDLQKWVAQRHNIFSIPPFKLGFVSQVGSMSAREQREEFASFISTIVLYECELLTLILLKTRLDYQDIEITAPGVFTRLDYERVRVVERLLRARVITPNEARTQFLGLSPLSTEEADQLQEVKSEELKKDNTSKTLLDQLTEDLKIEKDREMKPEGM